MQLVAVVAAAALSRIIAFVDAVMSVDSCYRDPRH